jgi:glycosyltransferase involved in cell wall biosynthesis
MDKRTRFTFVLPNLGVYGGIQSTIMMADALSKLGNDVTIVYPILPGRDGLPWWNIRKWAVQLVRAAQNVLSRPNWFTFSGNLVSIPYLHERYLPDADFLVVTWWADARALIRHPASCGRLIHFVRSFETWGGPPELVLETYRTGMATVTTSKTLARNLQNAGRSTECIIPNGLNPAFFEEGVIEVEEVDVPTVGMLYRVQDWKRAVDGLRALQDVSVPFRLVLFGEAVRSEHKDLVASLPDVEFVLRPTGRELIDIYRKLDVFLFTSDETEAFGNPPLEAMASGCAVVSTKVGAVPEYATHEREALLVSPRDIPAMTESVDRLLANVELRQSLVHAGLERSRDFSWRESATAFQAFCHGMTEES